MFTLLQIHFEAKAQRTDEYLLRENEVGWFLLFVIAL
jgi:hypothetical protein